MSELTGLRAIVTGGASGIGLATAQLLAWKIIIQNEAG